jgi:uncharacterized membrane protein YdbT with pleckstrin-like domain
MEKAEFSFNGQRAGEKVLHIVKNHPFVLFWPGLKAVFFLAAAVADFLLWSNQFSGPLALILTVVAFGMFFRSYYDYSQSTFVITNLRVIYVDQNGFWKRKIIEAERSRIQDISSNTAGIFRTMLKFGDLIIRTAGTSEGSEIVVKNIPNPYNIQQKIVNTRD